MQVSLRPFGFMRWIAPRRPALGVALTVGLLLAYAHNQVQELAIAATFRLVETMFQVEVGAGQVDVSITQGRVVLAPFSAHLPATPDRPGGEEVLRATALAAHFSLDWSSLRPRVERIELVHPHLRLTRYPSGSWNLERLLASDSIAGAEADPGSGMPPVEIRQGQVTLLSPLLSEPLLLEAIDVTMEGFAGGIVRVHRGRCRVRPEGLAVDPTRNQLRFQGRLLRGRTWRGEVEAEVERGDIRLLGPLVGARALEGARGDFSGRLESRGALSTYEVEALTSLRFESAQLPLGPTWSLVAAPLELEVQKLPNLPVRVLARARSVVATAARGRRIAAGPLETEVVVQERDLEVVRFELHPFGGRVAGRGRIGLEPRPRLELELSGRGLEAAALAGGELLGPVRLEGPVDLSRLTWVEDQDTRAVAASLRSTSLTMGLSHEGREAGVHLEQVAARLQLTTATLTLDEFTARGSGTAVRLDGILADATGRSDLAMELTGLPLAVPATVLTTFFRDAHGEVDARLRLKGWAEDLELAGDLQVAEGVLTGGPRGAPLEIRDLRVPFTVRAGGAPLELWVPGLTGRAWGASTTASLTWTPDRREATAEVVALPIEHLLELLGRDEVGARGAVDATLTLTERDRELALEGRIQAATLPFRPGGAPLGLEETLLEEVALRFRLAPAPEGPLLQVPEASATALGGRLALRGRVSLGAAPSLDMELTGKALDLAELSRVLATESIEFAGKAELSGQLEGPLDSPRLTARAVITRPLLAVVLGGKRLRAMPDRLDGSFALTPGAVRVGPLNGTLAGGPFDLECQLDMESPEHPWRIKLGAREVDLARFVAPYLEGVAHDLYGRLDASFLLHGRGHDAGAISAGGQLALSGGIRRLAPLEAVEKEFRLRNLHDIEVRSLAATLGAAMGKLRFRNLEALSSHGELKGEVALGLDGSLDGAVRVALDRMVLSTGHRLLSELEGGKFFNFDLDLGGTLADPDYGFRMKGGAGSFLKGAALFSPIAAPAALFMGLKNLFGGRRRPHSLPADSPAPLEGSLSPPEVAPEAPPPGPDAGPQDHTNPDP